MHSGMSAPSASGPAWSASICGSSPRATAQASSVPQAAGTNVRSVAMTNGGGGMASPLGGRWAELDRRLGRRARRRYLRTWACFVLGWLVLLYLAAILGGGRLAFAVATLGAFAAVLVLAVDAVLGCRRW